MSDTETLERVRTAFETHFGTEPAAVVSAPGRVNLLGEHTDYNGGFVLPMALDGLGVAIAIGHGSAPGVVEAHSETFDTSETRRIDEAAASTWSDYVLGCLKLRASDEVAARGCRLTLATTLPMGAGLSSSAALEVATFRAIAALYGRDADPVQTAIDARAVENDFVGMPCGIMDQFASSVGTPGTALFLNTRTLAYEPAPRLAGHSFVIVHSGVSHQLTEDGYATRVEECQAACKALGVPVLSDLGLDDLPRIEAIAPPMMNRARHIVTENARVLSGIAALKTGDASAFGTAMTASHASQRDDYAVSVPEVDALVEHALAHGAIGARLTGGGFGGSIVALVKAQDVDAFTAEMDGAFTDARVLAIT